MVSWASFTRYQELRQEASNFHKELLALKAKAVASGNTFIIVYHNDKMGYDVTEDGKDEETDQTFVPNPRTVKKVDFVKNVKIKEFNEGATGLPGTVATDSWTNNITIKPNNLDAFDAGRVIIYNSSNKYFCIQKDDKGIKPELYYRSGSGGQWKKV
jgi:hypothetical protein